MSDDLEPGEYRITGTCAVVDCTDRAKRYIVSHGQPLAVVCIAHEEAFLASSAGWVLRSHKDRASVVYPAGYDVPPFPE